MRVKLRSSLGFGQVRILTGEESKKVAVGLGLGYGYRLRRGTVTWARVCSSLT